MKFYFLLFSILFAYQTSYAVVSNYQDNDVLQQQLVSLDPLLQHMDTDQFLTLTPTKYREMTGEKLGFKKRIRLKLAQKMLKRSMQSGGEATTDIPQWAYIVLSLVGLGFLAMGLLDDWEGKNWLINLALAVLFGAIGIFFFPVRILQIVSAVAFVHALLIMKEYYN